ncbi:hypothetical protein CI1B_27590 [Bradyrhizobium ivorense]|uniref:CN hydrolase domain-containing protein n=1 Tax=Bradyrhizobium ivorense TaxID=2511166 RepID=A0A508T3U5_9BRAD|nr:hypothetical protein [Bradyrhizobium ivorense]VIO69553.1 hypothetical protein CI1B_27590 [Bradyrhizobium ivorense]
MKRLPRPVDSQTEDAAFDTWKEAARQLSRRQASIRNAGRDELRHALIDLDALFHKAPGSVGKAYRNLTEKRIETAREIFTEAIGDGRILWSLTDQTPELSAVTLGGLIREIDRVLAERRSQWPIAPSHWHLEKLGCWFIPRQGVSALRTARRGQAYSKRGMLFHRILPDVIQGYPVHVVDNRTLHSKAADARKWRMGACLFEALEPVPEFSVIDDEKRFIVIGIKASSAEGTISTQITDALRENCIAIVWPELTVPPDLREKIVRLVRDRDVMDELEAPELLIPGTWHETNGQGIVNRARIYDGYGEERLVYDKIAPYGDDDWGTENIIAGRRICVLATEGALIGIAVCLDFCDVGSSPFGSLDVDVMLVPSMGNDRTMQGHQTTATQVEVKFGTRSFVVQHPTGASSKDGRLGTILPLLKEPNSVPAASLGQKTVWKGYDWPV